MTPNPCTLHAPYILHPPSGALSPKASTLHPAPSLRCPVPKSRHPPPCTPHPPSGALAIQLVELQQQLGAEDPGSLLAVAAQLQQVLRDIQATRVAEEEAAAGRSVCSSTAAGSTGGK